MQLSGSLTIDPTQNSYSGGSRGDQVTRPTPSKFNVTLETDNTYASKPKPYRANLTPLPSDYRPHCRAGDRLRLWRPAVSRGMGPGFEWHEDDFNRLLRVANVAWAKGTRESYGAGLLVFHVFCDIRKIPEDARCPASPTLISMFVASCAGSYSGSALANYVYGVRAWHIMHGQIWAMDDQLKVVLDGAANLAPPTSKKGIHEPLRLEMIEALGEQLDPNIPLDVSVKSCLDVMYYSVARTGELTVPSLNSFNPAIHVKPSDVRNEIDRHGNQVTACHLPVTKSAPEGEDIFFAEQNGTSNPKASFANHFRVNEPPPTGHLFAYRYGNGYRPLTKHTFINRLNAAAAAAIAVAEVRAAAAVAAGAPAITVVKLPHIKGHSIRIRGTLEYLL